MKLSRVALAVLCISSLGACTVFKSHTEVEALNEAQAVGSPFTQQLAAEYREYANNEQNVMFDYPDALHFARKGLAAASGEAVMPEPISDWNLKVEHMEELSAARGRLVNAFDIGSREILPVQSAIAQARFDCWIEQQEENWQTDDIISCRSQFLDTMNGLETAMAAQAPVPEALEEPMPPVSTDGAIDPSQPMAPEDAMYLVFFDFDSNKIGSGGENVLDAVAMEVGKRMASLNALSVIGHTDTSGKETYNMKLSLRRANAVRDALIARGVDPSLIKVDHRGEGELLVETPDDVREPANRRVNISFE